MTNDTWNVFALRDILLGGLAAVGFLATIWGITVASNRVEQREIALREAKRLLKEQEEIETNDTDS